MRCARFGLWQGARRAHTPQWVCNRRATQPQAKFGATRRAAVLFRPDFVARSLQIHCGICRPVRKHLAPRLAKKSLAAHVSIIKCHSTSPENELVLMGQQCSILEGLYIGETLLRPSGKPCLDYLGIQ